MNNQQVLKLIGWGIALCLTLAIIHNVFISRHQESFKSGFETGYKRTKNHNTGEWLKYPIDYVRLSSPQALPDRIENATDSIPAGNSNIKIVPEDSLYSIWSKENIRTTTAKEWTLLLLGSIIYLTIFIVFINLIKLFSKGEVLHIKTYKNLLLLSFCVLLIPVFDYIFDYTVYTKMQTLFKGTAYEVVNTLKFDVFTFILGLVFLGLVVALKIGVAIKEENELTI